MTQFTLVVVAVMAGIQLNAQLPSDTALLRKQSTLPDTGNPARSAAMLSEVIVTTGYQTIPRERSTGSFGKISNKQINLQVSSDLLTRLEGSTPGLLFNGKRSGNLRDVIVRGKATFTSYSPLIVVDNFPYEGDLNNINPNDVLSITVLKDAAAASIWGTRAGNGVIVIKTKAGTYDKKPDISLASGITVSQNPDFFYNPRLSVADLVALEKIYFSKGLYTGLEHAINHAALSPVVELLIAKRDKTMTETEADNKINELASRPDVRHSYLDYWYRPQVTQRYTAAVNGGNQQLNYYLSVGYDKNTAALKGNQDDRLTINWKNTFIPMKGLEIGLSTRYTRTNRTVGTRLTEGQYPYEQVVDSQGQALAITRDYRQGFVATAPANGLLNWEYKPYDEIGQYDDRTLLTDQVINASIRYDILRPLAIEGLYQYEEQASEQSAWLDAGLYEVRNLVNLYAQPLTAGSVAFPLPDGDILNKAHSKLNASSFRLQLNYADLFRQMHGFNAIIGAEVRQIRTLGNTSTVYGYTDDGLTSTPVDYVTEYPQYNLPFLTATIPYSSDFSDNLNRYISYYGNLSYTFKNKVTLTTSARKDGANLFGVKTNQRWKPLWSAGIGWNLNEEPWYAIPWLPVLKLRATYGFTGSVAGGSAYTTAFYGISSRTQLRMATINQPPNPGLRWEKQRTWNIGVDFQTTGDRVSGSLEGFVKTGIDLISQAPLDPTTGYFLGVTYAVMRNYASIQAKGLDLEINTRNITGAFSWSSRLVASYTVNKIISTSGTPTLSAYLAINGAIIAGKSMGELYSYSWGGLDPATGNPIGFLSGEKSTDYAKFNTLTKPGDLVDNGPSIPPFYGSMTNTFSWKGISLSVSLLYKAGYFLRRNSFLFGLNQFHADFANRWQQPGDERITQIPSVPVSYDASRNSFYSLSNVLVEKADHIRLQFINLNYTIPLHRLGIRRIRELELQANATNLGILWRANQHHIDPDYLSYPAPPAYSLGAKINF